MISLLWIRLLDEARQNLQLPFMAFPLSVSFLCSNKISPQFSPSCYYYRSTRKSDSMLAVRVGFLCNGVPREPSRRLWPEFTHILATRSDASMELRNECDNGSNLKEWMEGGRRLLKSAFAAVIIFLQLSFSVPLMGHESWLTFPAEAVLYSPETKIPRTGELALRRAIPANPNMKAIQDSLEDISYLLRIPQRKPYGTMEGNVQKALKIATDEKDSILSSMPGDLREKGSVLHASLTDGKGGLKSLLQSIKDKDADRVSVDLASTLDTVAQLELLQAPGLSFLLPEQYLSYPRLTGRAVVEFSIEKADGSTFSPEAAGEPRKTAIIQAVIDGYSAPLTAGNFAKLVLDGAYDGVKLNCTEQAVLSDSSALKDKGYSTPLEIKPSGQFEPLYRTMLSVQLTFKVPSEGWGASRASTIRLRSSGDGSQCRLRGVLLAEPVLLLSLRQEKRWPWRTILRRRPILGIRVLNQGKRDFGRD
ncbi:peptidyl-prolyl cis-trans isomerase CYP37, chloroplastic isoform X2 [Andrographis paniculata]|uniref:peptidyl-prolyl cis-trans isomerase CYP37, chloroplastic isoform X2 n=1 Tax=Andrographis paniculata TaxID=175694 RepID=UPI0021E8B3B7|nr:peptidyl-prolyl cis-trans isomerase CYP37, chloroplastic isoform X2 [Andrographis paniculata]